MKSPSPSRSKWSLHTVVHAYCLGNGVCTSIPFGGLHTSAGKAVEHPMRRTSTSACTKDASRSEEDLRKSSNQSLPTTKPNSPSSKCCSRARGAVLPAPDRNRSQNKSRQKDSRRPQHRPTICHCNAIHSETTPASPSTHQRRSSAPSKRTF